jgi:flagellar FliL protein
MFGLKRKKAAPPTGDENDLEPDEVTEPVAAEKPKGKSKEKAKGAEKEPDKDKEKDKEKDKPGDKGRGKDKENEKDTDEGASEEAKSLTPGAEGGGFKGKLGLILGFGLLTLIAGGAGSGAGMYFASSLEQTFSAKQKAVAEAEKTKPPIIIKYSGDRVLQKIEPIVTNLASPPDTWIRLEGAIVFTNGTIANPQATAAEIRQDVLAYCRTLTLAQLQGPSALQHLREDLSERVSLRTNGAANELVIETMVVQ